MSVFNPTIDGIFIRRSYARKNRPERRAVTARRYGREIAGARHASARGSARISINRSGRNYSCRGTRRRIYSTLIRYGRWDSN